MDVKVKLKDERTALIRGFQIEDKEKFIEMYEVSRLKRFAGGCRLTLEKDSKKDG